MAGETNIQIVKAATASTVSRAPTTTPDDVVRVNQGQVSGKQEQVQRETAKKAYSDEEIAEFVQDIESSLQNVQRDLRFAVDKHSGDTVIKVIDRNTDEVIRQIPSEEIVAMRERIQSFTQGSLIDDEA